MKDRVITTARGVLLIILILSIPAILYAAFIASMVKLISYAEHHPDAVEFPFGTLGLIIAGAIVCAVVCGYGIIRLLRTRQKLDMIRALLIILAVCLMWLGITYL